VGYTPALLLNKKIYSPPQTYMLKQLIKQGLHAIDDVAVAVDRRANGIDCLVNVLFHSLYETPAQLGRGELAPNQNVTVADFRGFVEEMLESGYTVVSPAQIDAGLKPGGRYLAITFDDGYFNNALALDVLEQFRVPAMFFVSTDHISQNKAFWWDAFSRELSRSGVSQSMQKAEIDRLKNMTPEGIDAFLYQRFGPSVFKPFGDIDRAFTAEELQQFALNPWVHLGNHTRNHAILTNCTPEVMASQIQACQDALADMVGYRPIAIAYPNGNCSPEAVTAAVAAGLHLGFTVTPQRPRLPLDSNNRMTLGRFLFHGGQDIRRQCRLFSARFVPSNTLRTLMHPAY
jgi:peptidoglycan/xylan/chitin deacetylase (PgdA/CDA1 family)